MNRNQRRAAESKARKEQGSPVPASQRDDRYDDPIDDPIERPISAAAPARPGLILRIVAKILLSSFVLARVKSAEVERLLASVAMEAGKPEIANSLLRRQEMRDAQDRDG